MPDVVVVINWRVRARVLTGKCMFFIAVQLDFYGFIEQKDDEHDDEEADANQSPAKRLFRVASRRFS